MKSIFGILVISALLAGAREVFSQGFVNLDFEQAMPVSDGSSYVTSNAVPGWTPGLPNFWPLEIHSVLKQISFMVLQVCKIHLLD
jgi:hypothetical protein